MSGLWLLRHVSPVAAEACLACGCCAAGGEAAAAVGGGPGPRPRDRRGRLTRPATRRMWRGPHVPALIEHELHAAWLQRHALSATAAATRPLRPLPAGESKRCAPLQRSWPMRGACPSVEAGKTLSVVSFRLWCTRAKGIIV